MKTTFLVAIVLPACSVLVAQNADRVMPLDHVERLADLSPTTPGERARAKFFDRFGLDLNDPRSNWVTVPQDDVAPSPPPPGVRPLRAGDDPERYLRDRVCGVDLVFLGHADSRKTLLTTGKTWLFTDYRLVVERPIRPRALPGSVTASVGSGEVMLDGRLLRSIGPPLVGVRQPYVFFLRYLAGADGYVVAGTPDPVEMKGVAPYLEGLVRLASSCG